VKVSDELLDYVYEKAQKEMKSAKFPQKALDLLDYSCANVIAQRSRIPDSYKEMVDQTFDLAGELDEKLDRGKYEQALKVKKKITSLEKILDKSERRIFSSRRKLKLSKKDVDEVLSQLDFYEYDSPDYKDVSQFGKLAAKIKREIIGQEEAVDLVSKALIRSKLGLRSKKRPLGNFLFLGPTGVGKTELAKVIARTAFNKDNWSGLIRLDMSDFSEKHTVARLVGAPPGYVGYGEGGELTTKIEQHPGSVVLFDEIEKAHPDVLNILLQIMEEGELSDARGNTFDFSKAVVVLTSNTGTEILHNAGIGFENKDVSDKNLDKRLKENLKKILKPELLNRFDEIVVFKRLTKKNLMAIVNLLLKDVLETLELQRVFLKVRLPVKRWLIENGYSKEYGARALRRTIERELLDKVAQVLLASEKRPLYLQAVLEQKKNILIKKVKKSNKN
jgi:ATP-dependent Clp protease ATP-binding subunit ClpC